jgi:hypothetical protein
MGDEVTADWGHGVLQKTKPLGCLSTMGSVMLSETGTESVRTNGVCVVQGSHTLTNQTRLQEESRGHVAGSNRGGKSRDWLRLYGLIRACEGVVPTQCRRRSLKSHPGIVGVTTQRQARTGVLLCSMFGSGIPVSFMTLGRESVR